MWLLESAVRQQLQQAHQSGVMPSVEERRVYQAQFDTRHTTDSDNALLTITGVTAEIAIKGVITKELDFMALLFGGGNTIYQDIIDAISLVENNQSIEHVTFAIDSPGGQFDGLFDTLAAIQSMHKPKSAMISNVGASAAFAIASQTDTITASNQAARIGSIGVAASFFVSDDEIDIASTDAPKKRPDVTTKKGVAIVREELDAMHEIFADAIATGRGTTVSIVNAHFGQGGTLLAKEALSRGMIDKVAEPIQPTMNLINSSQSNLTATPLTANSGKLSEAKPMDIHTLQSQHPDIYQTVLKMGADQERDRVTAHLMMGDASGDMKTALKAVGDGSLMTTTLQATYMSAGMNRRDVEHRQTDDANANAGDETNDSSENDQASQVLALVEGKLNIKAVA